ncbi:MAG: transmembrane 220 family protein [Pseudomonadota bacterium]
MKQFARSIARFVAIALLLLMAWLQLNDPDPLYWVTVYAIAAMVPARRLLPVQISFLWPMTMGLLLAGLLMSAPGFVEFLQEEPLTNITGTMSPLTRVEDAREFLGLVIAGAIVVLYRH